MDVKTQRDDSNAYHVAFAVPAIGKQIVFHSLSDASIGRGARRCVRSPVDT